eukprot:365633-Chlamydomonas_euryale.AAC.5
MAAPTQGSLQLRAAPNSGQHHRRVALACLARATRMPALSDGQQSKERFQAWNETEKGLE